MRKKILYWVSNVEKRQNYWVAFLRHIRILYTYIYVNADGSVS